MLSAVAAAAMALSASGTWALGLGRMAVQSALGENLRAEIDVTSISPEEASSLRVRIAPPEAYRAAGVDYGAVLPGTQVSLARRADGRPYLRVVSDRVVQEPFVDVILELSWASGRLVREYTMLLDPPSSTRAAAPPPPPPVSPVISAAPAAPPPAPAPRAAAPAPVPRAAAPATAAAPPARAPRPPSAPDAAASSDEYRVRTGDTLSRIAARTQREGASLDQMLVALWRNNSQAFIDNNMNRLKAGSTLSVPSAAAAKETAPADAKQLIQAQSADFGAYRQRLASGGQALELPGRVRAVAVIEPDQRPGFDPHNIHATKRDRGPLVALVDGGADAVTDEGAAGETEGGHADQHRHEADAPLGHESSARALKQESCRTGVEAPACIPVAPGSRLPVCGRRTKPAHPLGNPLSD